jgi:hypothetical protein
VNDAACPGIDAYALTMAAAQSAGTRYAVRFGKLTFGERVVEAFATMGDAHDGLTPPALYAGLVSDAIEITDRLDGRVVSRIRDTVGRIAVLHATIAHALDTLDVSAFERRWLVSSGSVPGDRPPMTAPAGEDRISSRR